MNFQMFWIHLRNKMARNTTLETLKQNKEFTARYSQGQVVVFPDSTMHQRIIYQEEFLRVWNQAKNYNNGQQFVRSNYNNITRNGSYILAIFRYILGSEGIE